MSKSRLRAERSPDRERPDGDDDDRRHEHTCDPVGQLLYRGFGGLRAGDHRDDLRENAIPADLADADNRIAVERNSRAGDGAACAAVYGHGFAGDHRFVDIQRAGDDHTVGGDALAGLDDYQVADLKFVDIDGALISRIMPCTLALVKDRRADGLRVAGTEFDQ